MLDGNRNSGRLYTREAWDQATDPSFVLNLDRYYRVVDVIHDSINTQFFCEAGLSIRSQYPTENDRIQLLPQMWVVKIDETEYWDESFRKQHRIKRIVGVYIFNKAKAVHLCEMTPSYELRRYPSQWEGEDGFDYTDEEKVQTIDDEIQKSESGNDLWAYEHCHEIDKLCETTIEPGGLPPDGGGAYRLTGLVSVTEEDAFDEIEEYTSSAEL